LNAGLGKSKPNQQKKLFKHCRPAQSDVSLTVSEYALAESDGDGKREGVEDWKLEPPILHTIYHETGCRAMQLEHLNAALYQLRIYEG
jgi:hypothetical protein